MSITAPLFYGFVVMVLDLIVLVIAVVSGAVAFVHCLTQRSDGFPAIGTLPKGGWLAILGISLLLTLLSQGGRYLLFPMICIAAAMVYLLDVRAGLRDLSDGKGFW
jgi:hypothetical protein